MNSLDQPFFRAEGFSNLFSGEDAPTAYDSGEMEAGPNKEVTQSAVKIIKEMKREAGNREQRSTLTIEKPVEISVQHKRGDEENRGKRESL